MWKEQPTEPYDQAPSGINLFWLPGGTVPENIPFEEDVWGLIGNQGGIYLDVGCGDLKGSPHLIGVDAYYEHESIVKAYMWDMPFADGSVDGLVCMSALEHVSKYQVMPTLNEFARVVKPGGKVIVLVPNLTYVLDAFLQNPTVEYEMDMIFGMQNVPGQEHRTGFTRGIIRDYFGAVKGLEIERIHDVNAYHQMNFGIISKRL